MKRFLVNVAAGMIVLTTLNSCLKEIDPQNGVITGEQVANDPTAFGAFVDAVTGSLTGEFTYSGSDQYPYDFGYPSFFLMRDVMGQDIALEDSGSEWYTQWYTCGVALGPTYAICQMPWTYYYGWIDNCNAVLRMAGNSPTEDQKTGVGIAYAMRAMFYLDIARMFAPETYARNKAAHTVPIVTETTASEELTNNPRATNEAMYEFILSDLDKAEALLADYNRSDVYTPDVSVVYGLKARAYLTMEDWPNAEKYAKLAQQGYTPLTREEYLSQTDGFNKPTGAWMFGLTYKSTDANIVENDADSSWGSQMIVEVSGSGCGYAANYVGPKRIDAHLYSTIPATDFRRMCWIDPAIDELSSDKEVMTALSAYSNDPEGLLYTGYEVSGLGAVGYMPVKFRPKGGEHNNQYTAFTVAVPLMRVEEMMLIEAEAAGMQNEGRGRQLLTAFAQLRDPNYTYGTHTDDYYNTSTGTFRNEIWWQRRVELWGEGFATFDIKRLEKGIIRSYAGSNHPDIYQWNVATVPQWMHLCIVQTEGNYNSAISNDNNPTPIQPESPSAPYVW